MLFGYQPGFFRRYGYRGEEENSNVQLMWQVILSTILALRQLDSSALGRAGEGTIVHCGKFVPFIARRRDNPYPSCQCLSARLVNVRSADERTSCMRSASVLPHTRAWQNAIASVGDFDNTYDMISTLSSTIEDSGHVVVAISRLQWPRCDAGLDLTLHEYLQCIQGSREESRFMRNIRKACVRIKDVRW